MNKNLRRSLVDTLFLICCFSLALALAPRAEAAEIPENTCGTTADECTQSQALALAQQTLAYYQQESPQLGAYIANYAVQPGSEFASYCVRWTNPSGCYYQTFYRVRTFQELPDNPCGSPSQARNCTRSRAQKIAQGAVTYYQERSPSVEAYLAESTSLDPYYCARWTAPSGCYFAVYYYKPVVDYDPDKNIGRPACNAKCGNPINTAIGNKFQVEKDFESFGPGFARYYNSDAGGRTEELSAGWTHTYSRRIVTDSAPGDPIERVRALRPEGHAIAFSFVSSSWSGDLDVTAQLTELKNAQNVRTGWKLTMDDAREVEAYDILGRLTDIVRQDGRSMHLVYNYGQSENNYNDLRLTSVVAQDGRTLSFEYDLVGRMIKAITPTATFVTYGYDANGMLSQVVREDGTIRQYLYNEQTFTSSTNIPWALTGIVDESGTRFATFSYDASGRAVSTEHAGGVEKHIVSFPSSQASEAQSPLGATTSRTLSTINNVKKVTQSTIACAACATSTTSYSYDAAGRADTVTDPRGTVTDYDYDSRGLLTQQIDASNRIDGTKRTRQTTWNSTFKLPDEDKVLDAAGVIDRRSLYFYNQRGQLTSDAIVDGTLQRSTTYAYCEASDVSATNSVCPRLGLSKSINGPRLDVADVTSYAYYGNDDPACATTPATCPHRKGDLWKVTNALNQVVEVLRYDGAGRALSVKDSNGVVSDYEYNARGWLTAAKRRGANDSVESDDLVTRMDYWPTGLIKQVTRPDGVYFKYDYDGAQRLTKVTDRAGFYVQYTLDAAGNRVLDQIKNPAGNVVYRTASQNYNKRGQLVTQADAQSNPTDFTYDASGNVDAITDALGHVTDQDVDPLNRLSRTLQDMGLGKINAETKFQYDALDNLTKVTDPKSLDTVYTYNGFSDLTQLDSPDTGITTYTYDAAGNRKTQTDARGVIETYGYDALNRVTSVAYSTDSTYYTTYAYDTVQTACASGETFSKGHLTQVQNGNGAVLQYCYDRFGRMVRKQQAINGKTQTLAYAYTGSGDLQSVTYPDGMVVAYGRISTGRVNTVTVTPAGGSAQTLISAVSNYPSGPQLKWTYGNGRVLNRTHDQNYRPVAISDTATGGLAMGLGYDAAGRLNSLFEPGNPAVEKLHYDYDGLDRLAVTKDGASGTPLETYGYDATGNRTSFTNSNGTQTYTYPGNSHRLSAVGSAARTYDATGNTTAANGRGFVYTPVGRLGQVTGIATPISYAYNGVGEQVRRYTTAAPTATTQEYYVYDEAGHWAGTYDNTGAMKQQIIWLDDMPVGVINASGVKYIEPDHLGTPRAVIDPIRNVAVWTWDAKGEVFGNSAPNQNPDGDAFALQFDMRFAGQRYDSATGMNYNYFRDYDSLSGRYGQSDPIGFGGGISTYSYVGGNPAMSADPLGLLDIQARYACTGMECGYSYKFDFTTSLLEAYWDRFGNQLAGIVAKRSVPGTLATVMSRVDDAESLIGRFDSRTVGSSELSANNWKGIQVCAEADVNFEEIFDSMFPGKKGGYISESDAKKALEAFEGNLNRRITSCGFFNESCQDPYKRIKRFYDFENILSRANQGLDPISKLKVEKWGR